MSWHSFADISTLYILYLSLSLHMCSDLGFGLIKLFVFFSNPTF